MEKQLNKIPRKYRTKPANKRVADYCYSQYRFSAKRKNLKWDLDRDDVERLVLANCHYCGAAPCAHKVHGKHVKIFRFNGIDRLCNWIGYTYHNCVPCCAICNFAKNDMTYDEFMAWIFNLAVNLGIYNGNFLPSIPVMPPKD